MWQLPFSCLFEAKQIPGAEEAPGKLLEAVYKSIRGLPNEAVSKNDTKRTEK